MTRREFAATAAGAASVPLFTRIGRTAARDVIETKAQPFDLTRVRLGKGPFRDATERNRRYLHSLDSDRLLHMFRVTAGLPSSAQPLGGWERPDNELRGHFLGHYLSACAQMNASEHDEALKAKGNALVAELAKCQKTYENGYLSAFPQEFFERLKAGQKVWAPFYTLHKIMAGLLDVHVLCGNDQALDVLKGMASWTNRWSDPITDEHMAKVLQTEYGGMNEVLANLYAVTGDVKHLNLSHRFEQKKFFDPLAAGHDELKGLHVNTHIPKVIGAARRYELTGDKRYRDIAGYFWREVTGQRAYCTGGTSNGEGWRSDPGKLSGELGAYTEECCCTYNMLKLTRHLFGWTADAACADYYERALFNGILGTQYPDDGMTLYYVPLASGYWKMFALPLNAFWCCTGTGVESFSKLGDSIYFHDDRGLFVNLFIASELDWREKKVRVVQETNFPDEQGTTLFIRAERPQDFALRIRVPYWATDGITARVNGKPIAAATAERGYLTVDRNWKDGDKVEVRMPMSLHACPMPDDDTVQAFMYGPLVLVGELGAVPKQMMHAEPTKPGGIPEYHEAPVPAPGFKTASADLKTWIRPAGDAPLTFRTTGQVENVTLVPFYKLIDQRYGVYWKVTRGT